MLDNELDKLGLPASSSASPSGTCMEAEEEPDCLLPQQPTPAAEVVARDRETEPRMQALLGEAHRLGRIGILSCASWSQRPRRLEIELDARAEYNTVRLHAGNSPCTTPANDRRRDPAGGAPRSGRLHPIGRSSVGR